MNYQDNPLFNIEPSLIAKYLQRIGWNRSTVGNGLQRLLLTPSDGDKPIEIFLSSEPLSDQKFKQAFFAIKTLSDWYEKSVVQIASEILTLAYDIIASRVPDEYVNNDTVQLRVASRFINKSKDFLASAATTEMSKERSFKRTKKEALEYADKCRFGHTFRGSFGFLIESPVGFNDAPGFAEIAPDDQPFGRRVVERIVRGLESYSEAAREQSVSSIVNQTDGFSSNMCDGIADIIEDTEVSKIAFNIALSPEWGSSKINLMRNIYVVEMKNLEILRAAAKSLRTEETPHLVTIYGRITMLETEGNPSMLVDDPASREIEINWVNEDGQILHVKMSVSPEGYLEAVEAHKDGHPVLASGMLTRAGRTWRLEQASSFKVMKP